MFSKKLFYLLLLIVFSAAPAYATYLPAGCALEVGGRCFSQSEVNNLITLYGNVTTASKFTTLRTANATAGYTPSAGKKFRVKAIRCISTGTKCRVMQCDDDVGYDAASCTNPRYFAGGAAEYGVASGSMLAVQAGSFASMVGEAGFANDGFYILNGKYGAFYVYDAVGAWVQVYGSEEQQ